MSRRPSLVTIVDMPVSRNSPFTVISSNAPKTCRIGRFCSRIVVCFLLSALCSALLPCLAQQVVVPAPTEDARLHSILAYASYFWNFLISICVLLAITGTGLSAKLRDFVEGRTQKKWLQCILYLFIFTFALHIAYLPQSCLFGFFVPHYFKLSEQSFGDWMSDYAKSALIGMEGFVEGYAVLFFLIRKFQKYWPIFICIYYISLAAFNSFAYPMAIAPLFNTYTPMPECVLRDKIEQLAEKNQLKVGIPILIRDASKQTNAVNAQVQGFGSSMRIVVWDNMLKKMPEDEILAILAHEIGHYRLHHIYWNFLLTVLFSIAFVPINMLYSRRFVKMLPTKWNIRDLGDWAVTPVIILVSTVVSFLAEPIVNSYSRYIEHQADAFALRMTDNGPAYARAMIDLGSIGLADPNVHPFIEFWLFSHPSISKRVREANQYTQEHSIPGLHGNQRP